jgi:hypothetical protein
MKTKQQLLAELDCAQRRVAKVVQEIEMREAAVKNHGDRLINIHAAVSVRYYIESIKRRVLRSGI